MVEMLLREKSASASDTLVMEFEGLKVGKGDSRGSLCLKLEVTFFATESLAAFIFPSGAAGVFLKLLVWFSVGSSLPF